MLNKSPSYLFSVPLLLWMLVIALPIIAAEPEFPIHPHIVDIQHAERIILVTYADKHLESAGSIPHRKRLPIKNSVTVAHQGNR